MENSEQESIYLDPCKVQLLNHKIKPHDNGNGILNIDKLRLSFLEEELKVCRSKLSAYERSTSFILAQLQLINNWIESSFETQPPIDTNTAAFKTWSNNININRITSIANKIKYLGSKNCTIDENNTITQTIREDSLDSIIEDELFVRNEQEEEDEENNVNIIIDQENEIQDLTQPEPYVNSGAGKEIELEPSRAIVPERTKTLLKNFSCQRCSKEFPMLRRLKRHIRTHSNERPYKCQQCRVKLKTKSALNEHVKYVHTKDAKYPCKYCRKSFTRHYCLIEHERRHKDEKPHTCTTCDKKFVTRVERMHHEQVHSEGSFKCTFCDETFRRRTHLIIHISAHTGERPYACSLCNKTFIASYQLKRHGKVHTDKLIV